MTASGPGRHGGDDFESPLRRVLPTRGGRAALYAANLAVIVFLFAPLAVIVLVSFSRRRTSDVPASRAHLGLVRADARR